MQYSTPELVVVGLAMSVVQGDIPGEGDNLVSKTSDPPAGIALGLDD